MLSRLRQGSLDATGLFLLMINAVLVRLEDKWRDDELDFDIWGRGRCGDGFNEWWGIVRSRAIAAVWWQVAGLKDCEAEGNCCCMETVF